MARKVRFPLNMNDTMVRTLEELQKNFHLTSVLSYFENGKLEQWLRDRFNDDEADAIAALDKSESELGKKICEILGVEYSEEDDVDFEVIESRNEKMNELRKYTDDKELINNIDIVAFTQDDLYNLLDKGKDKIYLVNGNFEIPTGKKNVTYIGACEPTVKVKDASVLSDYGIKLENITLDISTKEYFNMAEKWFDKAMKYYKIAADNDYEPAKKVLERFSGESVNTNSGSTNCNNVSTNHSSANSQLVSNLRTLSIKSTFRFGKLNGAPIEWIVLHKNNDSMYVVSRRFTSHKRFDGVSNVWETSELRDKLNNSFYNTSFNEEEKQLIITVNNDRITLLSEDEVEINLKKYERNVENTEWWLRTKGIGNNNEDAVFSNGSVLSKKVSNKCGVRPAMWIKL